MASRFLFQKFSDGMSRSTSRFGTHISVSARAATVHETLGNVFHGSAAHLPGMTGLSNRGIHNYVIAKRLDSLHNLSLKQFHHHRRRPLGHPPVQPTTRYTQPPRLSLLVPNSFANAGTQLIVRRPKRFVESTAMLRIRIKNKME